MAGRVISCPRCAKPLRVPERSGAPRQFACPHCKQGFSLAESPRDAPPPTATRQIADDGVSDDDWVLLGGPEHAVEASAPSLPAPATSSSLPRDMEAGAPFPQAGRRRRARGPMRFVVPVSVGLGALLVAALIAWDRSTNRHEPAGPAASSVPTAAAANAEATSPRPPALPPRRPIRLLLAPDGARIVVHLRPAAIWQPASRGAELRHCLPDLAAWTERQIARWCLFPAAEIEEAVFCFVFHSPDAPPEIAATVWLARPHAADEIAGRFAGVRQKGSGPAIYVKQDQSLVIRDGTTFATGSPSAAQEMAAANEQPNPTDESIEELLKRTDRNFDLTIVLRPDDLERYRRSLFAEPLSDAARRIAEWLQSEAIEGSVLSVRLADPLRVRLTLRTRPATVVSQQEQEVRDRVNQLPLDVLQFVSRLNPRGSGDRKLVGRLPAMWKAVALGTSIDSRRRLIELESVLPERAAPNLALATFLAWKESTAMAPVKGGARPSAKPAPDARTVAERFQKKIDVDFRRMPLEEALGSIADEVGVKLEIDGGALKSAGYTKNMPQTLKLAGVPAKKALQAVFKPYPKLAAVVDEAHNAVLVTTLEGAAAAGRRPLKLDD